MSDVVELEQNATETIKLDLNETRERNFRSTILQLNHAQETNPDKFIGLMTAALNDAVVKPGETPILEEDLTSLNYHEAVSMSASELAGQEIVRPVFVLTDKEQFDKLYHRFAEEDPGSPQAFYLKVPNESKPIENVVGASIRHSGVIISRRYAPSVLGHEVRHTLETKKYLGFDSLLSETFAHATDYLDNPDEFKKVLGEYFKHFEHVEKIVDHARVVRGMGAKLRFGTFNKNEEWFGGVVGKVVDRVSQRSKEVGKINAQREVANAKTLEEYLEAK